MVHIRVDSMSPQTSKQFEFDLTNNDPFETTTDSYRTNTKRRKTL